MYNIYRRSAGYLAGGMEASYDAVLRHSGVAERRMA